MRQLVNKIMEMLQVPPGLCLSLIIPLLKYVWLYEVCKLIKLYWLSSYLHWKVSSLTTLLCAVHRGTNILTSYALPFAPFTAANYVLRKVFLAWVGEKRIIFHDIHDIMIQVAFFFFIGLI